MYSINCVDDDDTINNATNDDDDTIRLFDNNDAIDANNDAIDVNDDCNYPITCIQEQPKVTLDTD